MPDQRRHKITTYTRDHPGCTRAQMTRELDGFISKKTIDKYVDEMIENSEIEPKNRKKIAEITNFIQKKTICWFLFLYNWKSLKTRLPVSFQK